MVEDKDVFKYKNTLVVNYSQDVVFNVVSDVDKYPNFLPLCLSTKLINETSEYKDYEMSVGLNRMMKATFSTRNYYDYPNSIDITMLKGAFSHFKNQWKFIKINEDTTEVTFDIEFKFITTFLPGKIIMPYLDKISSSIVSNFISQVIAEQSKKIK